LVDRVFDPPSCQTEDYKSSTMYLLLLH
jgi:hypothetical protein